VSKQLRKIERSFASRATLQKESLDESRGQERKSRRAGAASLPKWARKSAMLQMSAQRANYLEGAR
jgi:hypothetical protein